MVLVLISMLLLVKIVEIVLFSVFYRVLVVKVLFSPFRVIKCGENRNHGKFKIYFLMVEL